MGRGLHLTLEKRIEIEEYLNEGENFKSIAKYISKDCTTVSKEIKNNYTTLLPSTFNNQYNNCDKKRNCKYKNVCGNNCDKLCRTCSKCNEYCIYFEQETLCEKLLKPPYCCNSCNKRKGCRKEKHIYKAKEADNKYREKLTNSREGINLTKDEFDNLSKIVKKGIKNGQSMAVILMNNPELKLSEKTLYSYVEHGVFEGIGNLDLPRKVKYKKRHKHDKRIKDTTIRENRTYEDYTKYILAHPNANIVQVDTVEGVKGGKCLLTLIFNNCNFMIAFLIDTQSSDEVISKFDIIKKIWGEQYLNDFEVILTDNGKEFSNPEKIEYFSDNQKVNLFYCDPGKSYQKGKVEKNHEFIRYILPKGYSFNNLTQNDIDLMMSHINSVPRKELNKTSPIKLAKLLIGNDKIKKLKYKKIDGNEIILKPILLNK